MASFGVQQCLEVGYNSKPLCTMHEQQEGKLNASTTSSPRSMSNATILCSVYSCLHSVLLPGST